MPRASRRRETGVHFSGICAGYIVVFLALSFVPASAAGKPTAATAATVAAEPSPPRSWEYCYELSRKLGWDHEADEWTKFIQDCIAGGDVASYAK